MDTMKLPNMKSDLLELFKERFDLLESNLNGNSDSSIHQKRQEAFKTLVTLGFPGRKHEEYKYTPITKVLEKELDGGKPVESRTPPDLLNTLKKKKDSQVLTFKNGKLDEENSSRTNQAGLKILSLSEAINAMDEPFLSHFNTAIPGNTDSFNLLNTSLSQEGLFLHVEKNAVIESPIFIFHITDGDCTRITNPRNLIVAEESSEITIVECFQTSGQWPVFANSLSEFIVKKNANIDYTRLGLDSANSIRVSTANIYQEDDSRFHSVGLDFGGKTVRNNLNIIVDGSGCESNMHGLYLLKGKDHVDNHTMIDHKKPNCESNELYKGILGQNARGVFNGKIYVRQLAQKTNAFQQNGNVLLSDEATINTKPQLEIWADDVKCSHGCTSGQIDDEQIFYLRSRGIDEPSARKILLHAYASEILDFLNVEELKEFTEEHISTQLAEM